MRILACLWLISILAWSIMKNCNNTTSICIHLIKLTTWHERCRKTIAFFILILMFALESMQEFIIMTCTKSDDCYRSSNNFSMQWGTRLLKNQREEKSSNIFLSSSSYNLSHPYQIEFNSSICLILSQPLIFIHK